MEKINNIEEIFEYEVGEESKLSFKESMISILKIEGDASELSNRKRKVIESLPDDFMINFKGFINESTVDKGYDEKFYGKKLSELSDEEREKYELMILRGELFEELVKHDGELVKNKSREGDELLALLQDPARFGLEDKLGSIRNPDLAYIDINEQGKIVVQGVGEAKFGLLNERALDQLRSFDKSMEMVKRVVNNLRHAKKMRKMGFEGLADRKTQMDQEGEGGPFVDVSIDLNITLIIPADREVEVGFLFDNLVVRGEETLKRKKEFQEILSSIDIKQSAFSVQEVVGLARYIYQEI